MYLKQLSLLNFKNYEEAEIEFSSGVNCITGNNGSGKTNILDALHYLSMCRSYFTSTDYQNIRHEADFFMVRGDFVVGNVTESILCSLKEGQKKQFKRNQKEYDRLNEHIGLLPVVMVAPVDQELITEGSEVRRKFLDRIISQIDKSYLEDLISYNKVLSHRNSLLKQIAVSGVVDVASFQIWDEQLVALGSRIYKKRNEFVSGFEPVFIRFYQYMTSEEENASLQYESQLETTNYTELLSRSFTKDRTIQFTSTGIHKDDLTFSIENKPAKKFGSQGQQKSLVMALKLAQFEMIKKHKALRPIVMLDDLFDKLDDNRVSRILKMVHDDIFGQLFITDTHPERLKKILDEFEIPFQAFDMKKGVMTV